MNQITSNKEAGFSLVELLVISALLAVLMLGFGSYMFSRARQNKAQEAQQNAAQLKNNITESASQPEALIRTQQLAFPSATP